MKKRFTAIVALLVPGIVLLGQTNPSNLWNFIPETNLKTESHQRQIIPSAYKTLELNVLNMQALLSQAPMWQTEAAEKKTVILALPMPDGTFQQFRIVEAPVMHPNLAAQFTMIKSYAGTGIDDPAAYLRFDMTQKGFHAMVRTPNSSTVYIDPYSTNGIAHYISYYKKDFQKEGTFECLFDEVNKDAPKHEMPSIAKAGDCKLRTYVLALACTGEYATFHGGTTAGVLAAMVTTMTRVNGVFENDCSIHMDLHPNTTSLIFLNASTDPYTNGNGSTMLSENQTTCDNVIGNANYDIGHVFSTGGGGVAYLGAVCNTSNKAGGVTGQSSPVGDPFDIDYVAHEMGHQFGANHTQNNNCNRNSSTAMEPGSASTIMGYAGICSPNVQNNSDDYFHAISIQEIAAEITSGTNGSTGNGGNTCSTNTTINTGPSANAGPDYTIPISTPFVLTGTGSDPNGDPITYTWEQMNSQTATMPPVSTSTTGPAFRSYKGTASPSRYLPRLQDLVNNVSPTWEVLASVGRTYTWRLTVRDNHLGGGCTAEDDMIVTVSAASGPFVVTAPNTAVSWPALSTQTVIWNVANTTAAPVSCANVDIFLSLDGGFTYPITLATATPNDGSHDVVIPDNQTTQARIMVKGSGNIFFDISNQNFTIAPPLNDFTLNLNPLTVSVCSVATAVFNVSIDFFGSFNNPVTLSTAGMPAGVTFSFSENPVLAPGTVQLTIDNLQGVNPGNYTIQVTGTSTTGTKQKTATLTVANGVPAAPGLIVPGANATGVSTTPTLIWASVPQTATYTLQVATDAAFSNIIENAIGLSDTTFTLTTPLNAGTGYFWRARAINVCGNGAFSPVFSFTTQTIVCTTYVSTDVPKTISSSGTPQISSVLNIPVSGTVTDIDLLNLNIQHTYINDLIVRLRSPANTQITLLNRICGSQNNIVLSGLDDESPNAYSSIPCPPNGGTYQPFQALSAFDGQNSNGTWTLTVRDTANLDGGSLQAWSLKVCYTPLCVAPVVNAPSVTQPTCTTSTGSILVNASGNGALAYSVNGGSSWQTSASFPSLQPGSYNIMVRLQSDTTCTATYSGNPVVLSEATGCCPANLAVNMVPIPNGAYDAEIAITSDGMVDFGGNVVFRAGNTIELLPGFEVILGGVFEVVLQGCVPP